MAALIKHFVSFYSPGTFCSEVSVEEVPRWDIELAQKRARGIKERYGATPYGFSFHTKERGEDDFDSKVTKKSPMYYLGGKVLTLADVEARNDLKDETLLWNMRVNGYKRIIENTNSWKFVGELKDDDVVLEWEND